MNILPHIESVLTTAGISLPIIKSKRPNEPDNLIVLYQTGGIEIDPNQTAKEIQDPTVQVFIRTLNFVDGIGELAKVHAALHQLINQSITAEGTTIRFMSVLAIAEGGHLGADETDREEFSINFRIKCHAE